MASILVDLDDVLYDFCGVAQRVCERAGITSGGTITQWAFERDYDCSREDLWKVLNSATVTGELYEGPPIPRTLSQLRRLRYAGHRVHLVTARGFGPQGALVEALTREWVRLHNVSLDALAFTKDKGGYVEENRITWALDDKPANCAAMLDAGATTFLMLAPHNQNVYGFPRVETVREFADIVIAAERGSSVQVRGEASA